MSKKLRPKRAPTRPIFVRQWREARGITQEQLAELIDASTATISRIESGKQNLTMSAIDAIAEALNVEPLDLMYRDPNNQVDTIFAEIKGATAEQQEQISRVVRALLAAG